MNEAIKQEWREEYWVLRLGEGLYYIRDGELAYLAVFTSEENTGRFIGQMIEQNPEDVVTLCTPARISKEEILEDIFEGGHGGVLALDRDLEDGDEFYIWTVGNLFDDYRDIDETLEELDD